MDEKAEFFRQPSLVPPPSLDYFPVPSVSRSQSVVSRAYVESRTIVSRASSIASHKTWKGKSRRPTIGSPTDFRRVEGGLDQIRQDASFRPLELSIYIPGNELPPLPTFTKNGLMSFDGLKSPSHCHVIRKSMSDTMLLQKPSEAFVVPRKPVEPLILKRASTVASVYSCDDDASLSPSMKSRSHSIYNEAISALPSSTQAFLDLLEDNGPRPPVPLKIKSHGRSRSPVPVRRKASDQNMRLQAHIEQRQQMESRLHDFDTILEEWQGDVEVSDVESVSRSRASSRAESTFQSTMERTLSQRNVAWSKSSPNLPYTRRPLPEVPVPPMPAIPRDVVLPTSKFSTFHLRSREPPFPPPSYAPPANPAQRKPQPPVLKIVQPMQWYHAQSSGEDYESIIDPYHHSHQLSPSMISDECPSIGSTWSTPQSSPGRVRDGSYPGRASLAIQDIVQDLENSPIKIEYGVAF